MPRSERPHRIVAVAGTAEGVGTTWVGTRAAQSLRSRGVVVAARFPVQTFDPDAGPTDADLWARVTGEEPVDICPLHRWYPAAMPAPMAAESLDHEPLLLSDLVAELRDAWPARPADLGLVELPGGPRSPLAHDGDTIDFLSLLVPDVVVVVADVEHGAVNAVRAAVRALRGIGVIVVLNRFDPDAELDRRSRDWLVGHEGLTVVTDVDTLAGMLLDLLPTFCMWTGHPAGEAPPRPSDDDELPRFCPRCGRRMTVTATASGWTGLCRDHGLIGSGG